MENIEFAQRVKNITTSKSMDIAEKAKRLARPTPEWLPKPVIDIPEATASDSAGVSGRRTPWAAASRAAISTADAGVRRHSGPEGSLVSSGRLWEISQFWQFRQRKTQPAVAREKVAVPG